MKMDSDGLVFWLSRTKTSGPGKKVAKLPVYVHKEAYLGVKKWLTVGFRVLAEMKVRESRDYLLPSLESDFSAVRDTPMSYAEALVSDRILLGLLKTPALKKESWVSTSELLMPEELLGFYSEHSERHFLPRLSIAAGFSREERDYLGRWSPSGADTYVMDAEHVVTRIQKEVSLKLRDGDPDLHRNRNETAAMSAYLKKRGHSEEHIGQLLSTLQPKLDCMKPSTTTNLKAKPDGIESDGSNDDEEKDTSVTPLEAMGFYPYWMGRASRKLHKTGATTCPWNPKGASSCVWIENESDARSQAVTYCKKCWPSGFEDEASDSDSSIDVEDSD